LNAQAREKSTSFWDVREAHASDRFRTRTRDVAAGELDTSRPSVNHAGDGAQGGRLARAVGAYARDHLARVHVEGDVTDHLEPAVAGGEAGDLEQRLTPGRRHLRFGLARGGGNDSGGLGPLAVVDRATRADDDRRLLDSLGARLRQLGAGLTQVGGDDL